MMLATNKEICSKEDVIRIARTYFSRWRIEEYFRCKKQAYQFENFRVRKLEAINALNFYITLAMAFLAQEELSPETNALKVSIIQEADPIKDKVSFCYYRLAKGSPAYCHMPKRASGSGTGQSVRRTVNYALS